MRKSIEQSIKRWLKRKVSITFGVIVAFLLGSIGAYGADVVIGWDGTQISVTNKSGEPIVDDNIKVEDSKVIFNDYFSHSGQITIDKSISGIEFSIENSGNINSSGGNTLSDSVGNGIGSYTYGKTSIIDSLINNRTITGSAEEITGGEIKSAGNGVGSYSDIATIKNLENSGEISGSGKKIFNKSNRNSIGNGVGIYSESYSEGQATIGKLTNSWKITGTGGDIDILNFYNSIGNGVELYSFSGGKATSTLGDLTNNGTIAGSIGNIVNYSTSNSGGNGVGIYSSTNANGTTATSTIEKLTNNWIISGNGGDITKDIIQSKSSNSVGNGVGVYSLGIVVSNPSIILSSTITALENSGEIAGNIGNITERGSYNSGGNGVGIFSAVSIDNPDISNLGITSRLGSLKNSWTIRGNGGNIIGSFFNSIGNGVGIFSDGDNVDSIMKIDNLENSGAVTGSIGDIENKSNNNSGGNGVMFYSNGREVATTLDTLKNSGEISGSVGNIVGDSSYNNGGNGVGIYSTGIKSTTTIDSLENSGKISGSVESINNNSYNNGGNGIGFYSSAQSDSNIKITTSLTNSGIVTGVAGDIIDSSNYNSGGNGVGIYSIGRYSAQSDSNPSNSTVITGELSLDKLENSGVLIGNVNPKSDSNVDFNSSGNGIGLYSYASVDTSDASGVVSGTSQSTVSVGEITNSGKVAGYNVNIFDGNRNNSGNGIGIYSYVSSYTYEGDSNSTGSVKVTKLTNSGTLTGNFKDFINSTTGDFSSVGNGIGIYTYAYAESLYGGNADFKENITVENLINSGTITGTVGDIKGYSNNGGNGIGIYSNNGSAEIEKFTNVGMIAGKNNGVSVKAYGQGTIGSYANYGIVAGKKPVNASGFDDASKSADYGVAIELADDGTIASITNGNAGTVTVDVFGTGTAEEYEVINADINGNDSYKEYSGNNTTTILENIIINGAGIASGTVTVNSKKFTLTSGVINGFEKAVTLNNGATFNGLCVIINGGGIRDNSGKNVAVEVKDDSTFTLSEKKEKESIVNGDISIIGNSNYVSLSKNTILNGDIFAESKGNGNTVTLGNGATKENSMNIYNKIENINVLNIYGYVTFFEKVTREVDDGNGNITSEKVTGAEITGADNINIYTNGVMNIRLGEGENGSVTNHALYNTDGKINIEGGGKLNFTLNGNGADSVIDLGSTTLGNGVTTEKLTTTSMYHNLSIENNQFKVGVLENLIPVPPKDPPEKPPVVDPDPKPEAPNFADYQYLNKIYQSITSSKQDGVLTDVDSDEKYIQSLQFFSDIFGANPYGYSSEVSRRTMEMQEKAVLRKDLNPDLHKWAIYGGLTHIDGGSKERFYGKGVKTLDVGSRDIEADSKITGGYMLAEYKYSDSLVLGTTLGGSSSDTDILHSKVEGDAVYLGAYAKKYSGNLRTTLGVGVHYGDYEADRVGVRYWNGIKDSYSENYNDLGLSIYGDIRYSLPLEKGFFLEPHITLSYTHIEQDGVDEGGKELAIETDDKEFNYTNLRTGVDLKKVIPTEGAKHTVAVGVAYDRLLDGYDEEYITGRMKGGSDFDILTTQGEKHSLSVNGRYEVEFENGVVFDVVGEYSFERDTHHSGSRSTSKGEWTVGGGIGYKF